MPDGRDRARAHASTRSACATTPSVPAATARARRCRGATSRARASRRPAPSRGCRSATSPGVNVAAQRADPGSPLHLTRDLIALRRAEEDLRTGAYARGRASTDGLWAYRRGDGFLVALNLGADAASMPAAGTIAIGTAPPARRRGDRGVAAAGARRGRRPARVRLRPRRARGLCQRRTPSQRAPARRPATDVHVRALGGRPWRMRAPPPASVLCQASEAPKAPATNAALPGRGGVGDGRQAEHQPGEGRGGGRVDGGEGEEARDEAVVGGRHRALGGRAAQREEPVEADGGQRGGRDERDRVLGGREPGADGQARRPRRRWRRGRRPARCPGRPGRRAGSRRGRRGRR